MKALNNTILVALGFSTLTLAGCASGPAAPFDVMKNSNVTAYRLQNYEPPAQAAPAAAAPQAGMAIPGIPPEVQQWAQQALPGLQQLIPPGLLPPGMLQQQPAAAPQPQEQVRRFVDFRILGESPVMDPELKEQLGVIFGDEANYQSEHLGCMYPELGLSFTPPEGGARYDMLVSFSCKQVNAVNFAWPFKAAGMNADMYKALADVVPQLFPSGGAWPQQPAQQQPAQQQPAAQQQPMGGSFNVNTQ